MNRTILAVRPYVWENIPGHIVLFVNQLDPTDSQGSSIAQLKQRFGGTQREMEDPYTHGKYLFDLTPWLHLPEETRLQLQWDSCLNVQFPQVIHVTLKVSVLRDTMGESKQPSTSVLAGARPCLPMLARNGYDQD